MPAWLFWAFYFPTSMIKWNLPDSTAQRMLLYLEVSNPTTMHISKDIQKKINLPFFITKRFDGFIMVMLAFITSQTYCSRFSSKKEAR